MMIAYLAIASLIFSQQPEEGRIVQRTEEGEPLAVHFYEVGGKLSSGRTIRLRANVVRIGRTDIRIYGNSEGVIELVTPGVVPHFEQSEIYEISSERTGLVITMPVRFLNRTCEENHTTLEERIRIYIYDNGERKAFFRAFDECSPVDVALAVTRVNRRRSSIVLTGK